MTRRSRAGQAHTTTPQASSALALPDALDEWLLVLRQERKSSATCSVYATAVRQLVEHQNANGGSLALDEITAADVRAYLTAVADQRSASTALTRHGGLQAFWRWATIEFDLPENPMERIGRPKVPEKVVPILSDDEIRTLLDACSGKDFADLRDAALIRMLATTGLRRSELANITLDDLDLRTQTVTVMGKGSRERTVHLLDPTVLALRRYLRARTGHRDAAASVLWLGKLGVLYGPGIDQAIRRRGRACGIDGVHCHRFRHTFAHTWLSDGGSEGGLMQTAGWRSRQMLGRYAASAASERSRAEHARLGIGDRY